MTVTLTTAQAAALKVSQTAIRQAKRVLQRATLDQMDLIDQLAESHGFNPEAEFAFDPQAGTITQTLPAEKTPAASPAAPVREKRRR